MAVAQRKTIVEVANKCFVDIFIIVLIALSAISGAFIIDVRDVTSRGRRRRNHQRSIRLGAKN